MRYGSVCSGIEAASVAWHPLGWTPAFFSEIERFASEVLAHHYGSNLPGERWSHNAPPNLGDMTKFQEWPNADLDVLVGGTPCQSFSVAGLRKGLADPRGNLALTYLAIADRYRPEWLVWENVPGVLSSEGGRDFGAFLGGLGELGYGFAYRVLDAQYVRVDGYGRAVPQRRRRVFVVGHSGDWRRAAAVLFERESLSGHPAPRRETGQGTAAAVARSVALRGRDGGGTAELGDEVGGTLRASTGGDDKPHVLIGFDGQNLICNDEVFATLDTGAAHLNRGLHVAHALRAEGFDASEDGTGRGTPIVPVPFDTTQITSASNYSRPQPGDPCHPLAADAHAPAIAFNWQQGGDHTTSLALEYEKTPTIQRSQSLAIQQGWAVRRLTPTECERLQGFPDGYTAITRNGKPAADGPRYKALGNSMACNVMRWIGHRIELVDELSRELEALE